MMLAKEMGEQVSQHFVTIQSICQNGVSGVVHTASWLVHTAMSRTSALLSGRDTVSMTLSQATKPAKRRPLCLPSQERQVETSKEDRNVTSWSKPGGEERDLQDMKDLPEACIDVIAK
jgi:hypothetical protein